MASPGLVRSRHAAAPPGCPRIPRFVKAHVGPGYATHAEGRIRAPLSRRTEVSSQTGSTILRRGTARPAIVRDIATSASTRWATTMPVIIGVGT